MICLCRASDLNRLVLPTELILDSKILVGDIVAAGCLSPGVLILERWTVLKYCVILVSARIFSGLSCAAV